MPIDGKIWAIFIKHLYVNLFSQDCKGLSFSEI